MYIIGLMSGTSLDGLDIAYCEFIDSRHFELIAAETYPYSAKWHDRLADLHLATAEEYAIADVELGRYFGTLVNRFMDDHPGQVDCIASHGHTIFHQPERSMTAQIGDGNAIHAVTGIPVVYDFRRLDVALGGQGAPLVPIGDKLLFSSYDCCLNLGGIANLSYETNNSRVAFDISPCNMALNYLASRMGIAYDKDGEAARNGEVVMPMLSMLETLEYYQIPAPKTLGKEWFEENFLPVLKLYENRPVADLMRTVTEHIALRITAEIKKSGKAVSKVLTTGGGANNRFLTELMSKALPEVEFDCSNPKIVDYKEAIIFALLAYLRLNGMTNTLASVTGASRDSSGGVVCGFSNKQFGGNTVSMEQTLLSRDV